MIFLEENNPSAFTFTPLRGGDDTGFNENFKAAYDGNLKLNRTDSRAINLREEWDSVITEIKDKTGKSFINPGNYLNSYSASPDTPIRGYNFSSKQILDFVKERPDTFPDLINLDNDAIFEKAKKRAVKSLDVNADVAARQTTTGLIGEFFGSALASVTDLPNVAAIFLTGGSSTIVKETFKQALAAGTSEAIIQTEVSDWYKSLNLPYDYKTFLSNVALASAGAGVMTVGVMGAKPAYQLTKKQIIKGIEALEKSKARVEGRPYEVNPDIKAIKEIDDINETINQGNVLKDDAGDLEHNARVNQSYQAIENGDSTKITNAPPESAINRPTDIFFHDNLNKEIFTYKPNDLLVDAKLFQFKAGGDVMGVTDRLQDIGTWDPIRANTIIVYEFADGRTFIADGHQRLGLAKRLQAADPSLNIEMKAFKLRESDGISVPEARATAAAKNISEGTGSIIDLAKVFKDAPYLLKTDLPRGQNVKQAYDLMRLEPKAFDAVINDVVPAHFGAIVGRYITDEAQQLAILQLLRRLEPANAVQAEQIVRQAREAGFVKTEQAGLFGDEDIAESLFLERAKILDRAMKELRKDKQLFETLVRNANDIEEAGNTLAKLSNEEKEAIYGKAIAIIENNANVRGPISDALTRIAKAWKDAGGTKIETYVREFTESVRRAIEDGSYERVPNGGDRGDLTTPAQSNRFTEPNADELKTFDEGPGSIGSKNQGNLLEQDILQDFTPEKNQNINIPVRKLGPTEIPQPNEPFVVFRFGDANETGLGNKNATNYNSLIETIDDGELGPVPGARLEYTDENAFIHAYVVTTPQQIGEYQGFNLGQKASATETSVGAKPYYGGLWYSFAENGNWQAEKIGQIRAIDFAKQAEELSGQQFYKLPGDGTIVERVFAQNNIDVNNPGLTKVNPDEYVAKSLNEADLVILAEKFPGSETTLRNLYQEAAFRKQEFDNINRDIANLVNAEYQASDLKGSSRAVEKIRYEYRGDATQIKDLLRSTIVVNNFQQAGVALREVRNRFQALDSGFRNLLDPNSKALNGGYRDIKINVNVDGHIAEVQINFPELIAVKDKHHKLYEERDNLERIINDEGRGYTKAEEAQIDKINATMKPDYDAAFEAILNRSNSALSTGAPLRLAEDGGKGLGAPLSQAAQIPAKPGTEPSVTGIPSTSRNSTFLDDFIKDTPDLTLAQIGTGGKRNMDLMELEVPIAERIDPVTGERISEVQTVKQILDDFEQDKSMLERLVGCVK
jgi:hypothetical protein